MIPLSRATILQHIPDWTNPIWIFPGAKLEIGARFTVTLRYKTNADGLSVSYPG
jgi:hypothetical protein